MNYTPPYSLPPDETIIAAWDSQLAEAAETPWLADALTTQSADLFPRFAACYAQLRVLPRSARRALQRQLRSQELTGILPKWLQRSARRSLQRKLACSLAGAALLLALGQGVTQAATIIVNTNNPRINDGDGKCSLIEAIVNANDDAATHPDCAAGSGADTIVLPKKTHTLTDVDNGTYGDTGLPVITSKITIQGNGAKITRQKSTHDHLVPDFRLMAVSYSGDLTLKEVTLSGGAAYFNGGGLSNYGGTVTIENSTISGNTAEFYGGGVWNSGILTIENSTISKNTVYDSGGGIFNYGHATIENSTISGNTAEYGGGIFNGGSLTIKNSTISANTTDFGGGIFNDSAYSMTLSNSTISQNTATDKGGGIFSNFGPLTIQNSTISGNTAGFGGGISHQYNFFPHSYLTLNRSLISGNNAATGPEVANDDVVTADDFNLFGLNGNAGVTGFTPGASDIVPSVKLSKIIGPLKNNGGPTKTHALVGGSPAVNAVPLADPGCTGTDQRGVARPRGPGCDIGAFER